MKTISAAIGPDISQISLRVLKILLQDKATGKNIVWATDNYIHQGEEYAAACEITPELITGSNAHLIQPRVLKTAAQQADRTRRRGEVMTPAWICNKMNNALDTQWFGRAEVFNLDLNGSWVIVVPPIQFPEGKTWQQYVDSRRMEITCGEAPFLVSRYDSASGEAIALWERVGLLDRKLQVVGENAADEAEWLKWAMRAVQSTYGYEYQGDNLLLARLNVLMTYSDYLRDRWKREPTAKELEKVANVIAWNLWQMDGLRNATPIGSLEDSIHHQYTLFDDEDNGPQDGASYCRVYDWRKKRSFTYGELAGRGKCTMKFDFVIGNPPYQDETVGEQKTFAPPIYHLFLDEAYKIGDKVELIHPARFLFNAGNTPKAWNEKMLNDCHLKVEWYEHESGKVFPNTLITGGVVITYRDKSAILGPIETFTSYPELNVILKKTMPKSEELSLVSIIHNQLRFDLDALYAEHPELTAVIGSDGRDKRFRNNIFEKIQLFSEEQIDNTDIHVIGVIDGNREWRYISRRFVDETHESLWKYKALLSSANGASGTLGEKAARITTVPFLAAPGEGFTQTFISIGAFESQKAALACVKYLKTKFARVMLGVLKVTQDNKKPTWKYVPLQDFTERSDIDWSKSISEIDRQLYKKYGLDEKEIAFIESHVKEMV